MIEFILFDCFTFFLVIRVALLVQNSTVAINCVLVVGILIFKVFTESAWNGVFFYFIQGKAVLELLTKRENIKNFAK